MSKKPSTTTSKTLVPGFTLITKAGGIEEYLYKKNGLRVLFHERKGTGVITSNITYLVGARDEARGETGLAHMLEHMLFKPTTFDLAAGIDSGAMQFERDTGCTLNANTWRDRTTYFFSYPKDHFNRALRIEAERMTGVVLTDVSLKPERDNVLSEFDMYNGDQYFALSVAMVSTAYVSHPYGHETIGYREDIEDYTASKLEAFYRSYYRPDNAVLMVVGDCDCKTALTAIKKYFGVIERPLSNIPRFTIREPKQEGLKRVSVVRKTNKKIVSIGFKQAGFPSESWFTASIMLALLVGNDESILHKLLVDTGKATSVDSSLEPSCEENLATITITLAPGQDLQSIETLTRNSLASISLDTITPLLKKVKAQMLTSDAFSRDNSLQITGELTEYTAAGDWTRYTKTPETLKAVTPKKVQALLQAAFSENNLTIGYFSGLE
jgi:zinc protease